MANKNQTVAVETEQQLNKTEAFFDKYKKAIIIGVVAVVVLIVGGILINNYYLAPREDAASTELAKSQELFNNEQFEQALTGFKKVASDYSSTKAGNLAQLYIGLCQANLGKWQEAADALDNFNTKVMKCCCHLYLFSRSTFDISVDVLVLH